MSKYDAIVAIGYSFDENWQLPEHLVNRLKLVAKRYREEVADKVVVTGYHSIHWDWEGVEVPVRECDLMGDVLLENGVAIEDVIKEDKSRDTPGNIYYLKTSILIPQKFKSLLVVCATHHLERVKFLVEKILGPEYTVDYENTDSPGTENRDFMDHEKRILAEQQEWLSSMPDGEHGWLEGKFYSDKYYSQQTESRRRKRDMHATINLANK